MDSRRYELSGIARTLRVNPDGTFELSDQGCPHETDGGKDASSTH